MVIPAAVPVSSTPDQASHPVDLYMYTDGADDVLSITEPSSGTDQIKECDDSTGGEGERVPIGSWTIDLEGPLDMDDESITFNVWAQEGNGGSAPTESQNIIRIGMDFMKDNDMLANASDEHIVENDPVEFVITVPEFSFSYLSGDTLGFRLWYEWEDADGTGAPLPPNDLDLVYGSTGHDAKGNIPSDYVAFSNENRNVDEDEKTVEITARVADAFGTSDLPNDFDISVENDEGSYQSTPGAFNQNHNEGGSSWGLNWIWDYSEEGDAAEPGDHTAFITATDARGVEWTTTVQFTIPEDAEPEYGVDLGSPEVSQTAAPDEDLSFDVTVENTGNSRDSFVLKLVNENAVTGWNPQFGDKTISNLDPGKRRTIKFTVSVPTDGIESGEVTEFQIRAESENDGTKTDDLDLDVQVVIIYDVFISAEKSRITASVENEGIVRLTVENTGNIDDDFTLSARESEGDWNPNFDGGKQLRLEAGQIRTVDLYISPPEDMKNGDDATIEVKIESDFHIESSSSIDITAEVAWELTAVLDEVIDAKQDSTGVLNMVLTSRSSERERVVLSAKINDRSTTWVSFHEKGGSEISSVFILDSGSVADIEIKIKVPENAELGDHDLIISASNTDGKKITQDYEVFINVGEKEESSDDTTLMIGAGGGIIAVIIIGMFIVSSGRKKSREEKRERLQAKRRKEEEEEEEEDEEEEEEEQEKEEKKSPKPRRSDPRPTPEMMAPGRVKPMPMPRQQPMPGGRPGYPPSPYGRGAYPPPQQPMPQRPPYPQGAPPPGIQPRPGMRPPPGRPPYQPQQMPSGYPGAQGPMRPMPPQYGPPGPPTVTIVEPPTDTPIVVEVGGGYNQVPAPIVVSGPPSMPPSGPQPIEEEKKGRFSRKKKEKPAKTDKQKKGKKGRFGRKKDEGSDQDAEESVAVVEEEPMAVVEEAEEEEYEVEVEEEAEVEAEEYEVEEEYEAVEEADAEEYEVEEEAEEYEVVEEY